MENSREKMISSLREAVEKLKESLALMEKELAFLEGDESVFVDREFDLSLDEIETPQDEVQPELEEHESPSAETDGDLFGLFAQEAIPAEPENINEAEALHRKPSLIDMVEEKPAWRTDIPGAPVHNILSAVSLNDRVMFINALFDGDPLRFQETVASLNSMESFDEAESYVRGHFDGWDLGSDTVYRFMMAVRRKLR